ncbi:MAG: hypothetical protein NC336_05225 [Clostridium sp.]|nr:hypothetical protein [Clostridium sp.]
MKRLLYIVVATTALSLFAACSNPGHVETETATISALRDSIDILRAENRELRTHSSLTPADSAQAVIMLREVDALLGEIALYGDSAHRSVEQARTMLTSGAGSETAGIVVALDDAHRALDNLRLLLGQ